MSTMKGDDRLKDVEWPSPTGTCPVILSEAKNLYTNRRPSVFLRKYFNIATG